MAKNIDIPDGWEVKKLGEIGNFFKGKGIKKDELCNNGLPCIIYGQIYTSYEFYTDKFISFIPTNLKPYTTEIYKNDILFAGSGETKEEIGKSIAYIGKEFAYAGGDIIILRQNKVQSLFITYYLNSMGRKQLNRLGQGDSVVHIYKSTLENVKIPVPPLDEQKKIADILSLWDKAIQQTKELIAYKETQKKGLMQNLLTGKKRLHGFNDEWKTTKLGEVAEFISGYSFSSDDFTNSGLALIKISNINNEKIEIDNNTSYLPLNYEDKYNKFIIRYNDILIAMSGATTGKMGVYNLKDTALLNQRVGIIRAKANNNQIFLIYILKIYSNKMLEMAYGGAQPNISFNDIYKIKIKIPNSIDEQKAIADILSKADEEINLLNKQLDLYTEQKKGLMQNLLTGKVRV
ncbi:MAG: restriction endonuclease subunit S [Candidatus Mucispirillum faecigallinarum]|nr:restriction endonuclease subunit S [Candidatus Mucispirillum faecigallinarum]